jgi:peroxiredoxin
MNKTQIPCLILLVIFFVSLNAREESDIVLTWKEKFDSAKTMTDLRVLRSNFEQYFDRLITAEAVYDSFYVDQAYIYYHYPDAIWRIRFTSWQRLEKEHVSQDSLLRFYNDIKKEEQEVNLAFLRVCQQIEDLASHSRLHKKYLKQKYSYDRMQFRETIDIKPLPDFSYKTLDGQSGHLSNHRGKHVLLYFWGMECPPCIDDLANVRKVQSLFQDSLLILGISADTVQSDWQRQVLRNFITEMDITWPQVADGIDYTIHKKYFVDSWPTLYLINPQGYYIQTRGMLRGDKLEATLRNYIYKQ